MWRITYLFKKTKTQFHDPISVEKQVVCTFCYLADEGRLHKAANHTQLLNTKLANHTQPVIMETPFVIQRCKTHSVSIILVNFHNVVKS